MPISTQSAKAKGRRLQVWLKDRIMAIFPWLEEGDVESRSMGANGTDIMLSPLARRAFPYAVEAKNLAKIAVYGFYEQAASNAGNLEPLVIIKANRKRPLIIVDAEHFLELIKRLYGKGKNKTPTT